MSFLIPRWFCNHKTNRSSTQINSEVYTQRNQSALSIKNKQKIISRLEKGEKGTNLSLEFKINKQQISYIHARKNEEKKDSEIHKQRRDEGLKIRKYLRSVHKLKLRD